MVLARPAVTLKQLAAAAGVSLAAASYALRGHGKVSAATRRRVVASARRLGYRPNPRVASLMAHIRRGQAEPSGERLAFIWVHTTRAESRRVPYLRQSIRGARRRAAQMGFGLEEFWTDDPGMNPARLEGILRARGIVGVVFSPVATGERSLSLDWDWRHFAAAVIGNVPWTPELHHAGHHHYLAMRMALEELGRLGHARPVALIEAKSSERARRAWEGAFLTSGPNPAAAAARVKRVEDPRDPALAAWVERLGPDALIVSETALLAAPGLARVVHSRRLRVATLFWSRAGSAGLCGVDQAHDQIAAHAVDLVAAQLNSNEFGVPALPRIMLFPGRWVGPSRH
jgi:LacI family transcriptional regulator